MKKLGSIRINIPSFCTLHFYYNRGGNNHISKPLGITLLLFFFFTFFVLKVNILLSFSIKCGSDEQQSKLRRIRVQVRQTCSSKNGSLPVSLLSQWGLSASGLRLVHTQYKDGPIQRHQTFSEMLSFGCLKRQLQQQSDCHVSEVKTSELLFSGRVWRQKESETPAVKSLFKNTHRADMCDLYGSDTWDMSLMRIRFKISDSKNRHKTWPPRVDFLAQLRL